MSTLVLAHRGLGFGFPENTQKAFAAAAACTAIDGVELDVQRSRDGELVVIHDENLERLTGSAGLVKDRSWRELADLNAARHDPQAEPAAIPRLEEVLELFLDNHQLINIELKNNLYPLPGLEEELVRLVSRLGLTERVVYSSFNHVSMRHLVSLGLGAQTGLLFSSWLYEPWNYTTTVGAGALHPSYNVLLYPGLIERSREANLRVRTWTVDLDAHIDLVLALNPETIISNRPLAVAEKIAAREADSHET